MSIPIRVRLTIWYGLLLAATLGVFAASVHEFLEREERQAVDRVLQERAAAFAHAWASEAGEEPGEQAAIESTRDFAAGDGDAFVYARPARLLARSSHRLLRADPLSIPAIRAAVADGFRGRTRLLRVTRDIRAIVAPVGGEYVLVATEPFARELQTLARVRDAFALAIPAALLIAAAGGYVLVRRSLAPVASIAETASRIEAENLSERIAVAPAGDELSRLATVLNALFDRLEHSFAQQRRLLADTSHELRTPVTIIRSEAEVALARQRTAGEYREALESVRAESAHLTALIERVMLLSRADAHQIRMASEPLFLNAIIRDSVRAAEALARTRGVHLSAQAGAEMPMRGDAEMLRNMLLNLLENAIKFSDPAGRVTLDARRDGPNYTIAVSDTGHGIAPGDQTHIFDRFFRGDRARARDDRRESASGAGLGLSIVRWIAEAHGGSVRLVRSTPAGSLFEVALPAEESASVNHDGPKMNGK